MLTDYFQDMFDELPTIVSDAAVVYEWAAAVGLPFRYLEEAAAEAPSAALIVLTTDQSYSAQGTLHKSFTRSRALWLPLAAFDGSDDAVSYGLRHLEKMDFTAMVHGHEAALKLIEQTSDVSFQGNLGTDVQISFGSEVEFTMLRDLKVPAGDQPALASFFEFETEIDEDQFASGRLPFVANGTLRPSGVLCAYGPGTYHSSHQTVSRARRLARQAALASTTVEITGGVISRITMGADDVTQEFGALAGQYGLHISEFAIGFYRAPEGSMDWQVNSPVNEGAQGIHLGIGDGYSGMHFDFVCDDVSDD